MKDVKFNVSKMTVKEMLFLGSKEGQENPAIGLQILDKYVEGGLLDRPMNEVSEVLKQITIEIKLMLSQPLQEIGDIVEESMGKDV